MSDARPLIDIHIPGPKDPLPEGSYTDPCFTRYDRAELAMAIVGQGADVSYTRGHAAYDFDEGVAHVLRPTFEGGREDYHVSVTPELVAIDGIHAVRNMVSPLRHGVPELNHPELRRAAYDKAVTNNILQGIGLSKEFAVVGEDLAVDQALEELRADVVVVKPRRGQNGRGIRVGTKSEVAALFADGKLDKKDGWVVEELLDFSIPLAVRGADEASQARIEQANADGRAKELRAYAFGRDKDGSVVTSFVMRAALDGHRFVGGNDWIYVDQDRVPERIVKGTDEVLAAFEHHAGIKEAHVAIDWAEAVRHDGEPITLPMEVNASRPQLVYRHENPRLSDDHKTKMAKQLIRVAERGGTE